MIVLLNEYIAIFQFYGERAELFHESPNLVINLTNYFFLMKFNKLLANKIRIR